MDERLPAAHEEWCTGPQHDGQAEQQFAPGPHERRQTFQSMPGHRQNDDDDGERQTTPEAAAEIQILGVVLVLLEAGQHRFEGHAALGTSTGADLPDFRVHRAGVFRAGADRFFLLRAKVRRRVRIEPGFALGAAKSVMDTIKIARVGRFGLYRHSANGINGTRSFVRMRQMFLFHVALLFFDAAIQSPLLDQGVDRRNYGQC